MIKGTHTFIGGLRRVFPARIKVCVPFIVLGMTCVAYADQYHSEVRELDTTPPEAQQQDAKKLLESTTDPYARALLLRDLAGQAVDKKDYDTAAGYLEQALGQNALSGPAAEQMRKNLTQLRVAGGKPADVIRTLEPRVKGNAQASAEEQMALAAAYLQVKRYKDALPLVQRAVTATPNPDESWLQAFYAAAVGAGQEKEALPVLEKLVRRTPGRREYWLQLASLYHKAGNPERALATLELASRLGHLQSEDERLQLIGLTAQLGAPFEAGSLLQGWMEGGQVRKDAGHTEMLAGLWMRAHETDLAISALRDLMAIAPRPELSMQLGQLYLEEGRNAEAATALNAGLQDARTDRAGPVLLALGAASFNSGNVDGAIEAFTGAMRFPTTSKAAGSWLEFLRDPGALEQAKQLAKELPKEMQDIVLSNRLLGGTVTAQGSSIDLPSVTPATRSIGGRLTQIGAERDANADGSIPEWTGGITTPPAGFKPGGRLTDPYPDDKPLFTITLDNVAKYAAHLSDGHRQLFAKYKTFRMPVYPTRRSAVYPQAIYDATQANLGKARLIGSDALTHARLGFPFPQPENGVEVMWNHRTRFRGNSLQGVTSQAVVSQDSVSDVRKSVYKVLFRYGNLAKPADIDDENILVYGITWSGASASGERPEFVALFHETANSIKKSRAIWVLLGKVGKMLRLPPLGYDQPLYGSQGLAFIDMIDMYNGAFDRYVWKLVGKRELYIPYNAYRLDDGSQKYAQQLTYPTFNADNARYELHRVWVIEATERGGKTHAFGKRIFYVDEDTWNIALVENQDHAGKLWRFQEGHMLTNYEVKSSNCWPVITYDLQQGRYFAERMLAEDPPLQYDLPKITAQDFLPAAVQRKYSR